MAWEGEPAQRPGRAKLAVGVLVALGVILAVASIDGEDDASPEALDIEGAGQEHRADEHEGARDARPDTDATDASTGAEVDAREEDTREGVADETGPSAASAVLPGETGLDMFILAVDGSVARIDLDSGEVARSEHGARGTAHGLYVVGETVLIQHSSQVSVMGTDLAGPPEAIAEGQVVFPAFDDGTVWILHSSQQTGELSLMRVRARTGAHLGTYPMPGTYPLAHYEDGLLVSYHGRALIYDPERGDGREVGGGGVVAFSSSAVAWADCRPDLSCDLVVTAVDGSSERRVPLPEETPPPMGPGVLSPTGDHILQVDFTRGGAGGAVVLDTAEGTAAATFDRPGTQSVWAPDGSWLFWIDSRGQIVAWRAADGETVELDPELGSAVRAIAVR